VALAGHNYIVLGELIMPNIKPVSDLRNYNEVLRDIAVGAPVFLTKNGRGRYAIMDIEEYEKTQAKIHLMSELAKGEKSGREKGWLSLEEVERNFSVPNG
jgi:PHD/YefM family antitoxin component YafN of YafNO toxin-antitoxin module